MLSYVYIIQSGNGGAFYIGYTKDLERRIATHQAGMGGWTAGRGPWSLRYYEQFEDDTLARKRELQLKGAKNKTYLAWLILNGPGSSVG